jgi:hypothetical protein
VFEISIDSFALFHKRPVSLVDTGFVRMHLMQYARKRVHRTYGSILYIEQALHADDDAEETCCDVATAKQAKRFHFLQEI